jgi:glycosyltransferase involved in cell wall biosynthesis
MSSNIYWDIAIAPLEDNSFTRCKSDIKFLDYSALGIAGIYSRVAPYEKTVRHLETGYLANNSTEDWVKALDLLLKDDSLRQKLARRAKEYVLSARMLKQCAKNWHKAILSIVNQRNAFIKTGLGDS